MILQLKYGNRGNSQLSLVHYALFWSFFCKCGRRKKTDEFLIFKFFFFKLCLSNFQYLIFMSCIKYQEKKVLSMIRNQHKPIIRIGQLSPCFIFTERNCDKYISTSPNNYSFFLHSQHIFHYSFNLFSVFLWSKKFLHSSNLKFYSTLKFNVEMKRILMKFSNVLPWILFSL